MDIEIVNQQENALLSRIEIEFKAVHPDGPTPKRDEVREALAKQFRAGKDRVVVDHMNSEFGRLETNGYAKIYASKEALLKYEAKHKLKRNKIAEPAKEKPAEGSATE